MKKNQEALKVLENEAIDFVNNIYKKYKGKVDYFIAFHVRDVSDIDKREFENFLFTACNIKKRNNWKTTTYY
ncbi:MAG: hypothetical protein ABDH34_05580 [Dictyoglomus thermophilum]|uniref:Uncharacterized protein n=1 Tax=Dictyoglomus thermophilum TaxID=14 RepID=A0A7V3ZIT9_DICTH